MKPLTKTILVVLIILALGFPGYPAFAEDSVGPTFSIIAVDPGSSVTIQASNFPARTSFDVLIGSFDSKAVDGIKVGSVTPGTGGAFTATFAIPASLSKEYQIAVRFQSVSNPNYYAYNWFYNERLSSPVPQESDQAAGQTVASQSVTSSKPIPTFTISGGIQDRYVTITTYNFPANDRFEVLMGLIGTRGIGGVKVATIDCGKGGTLNFTFNIPAALREQDQIAIRLQSITGSGYFSYNWFQNSAFGFTGGLPHCKSCYHGYPSFSIFNVLQDHSVTITTYNLPKDKPFQVTMGPMGTRGIGGYIVSHFNTGAGGVQTLTFTIPPVLYGHRQIAIRMQATDSSGYYAYNWFFNN